MSLLQTKRSLNNFIFPLMYDLQGNVFRKKRTGFNAKYFLCTGNKKKHGFHHAFKYCELCFLCD